jgi:hypothetical protein
MRVNHQETKGKKRRARNEGQETKGKKRREQDKTRKNLRALRFFVVDSPQEYNKKLFQSYGASLRFKGAVENAMTVFDARGPARSPF